jgi:hypothetical protein
MQEAPAATTAHTTTTTILIPERDAYTLTRAYPTVLRMYPSRPDTMPDGSAALALSIPMASYRDLASQFRTAYGRPANPTTIHRIILANARTWGKA